MEETTITGRAVPRGRTEAEYRSLEEDSSSSIKVFAEDRLKYYKKFVKGEFTEDEDGVAIIIGKLVDCILLGEEGEFDEKFFTSTVLNPPTAMMLDFVEALYKITMDSLNDEGEVTRELVDMMKDAYNAVKFDRDGAIVAFKTQSYEKTVEKFLSTEAHAYYKEIRTVRPNGMTVISPSLLESANRIVEKLKTSVNTCNIFTPDVEIAVFNQLKINGFEIDGLPLKGMIDRTHIEHDRKLILPFDLKVTWDVENFYENYYLKRKTYFQAYIYHKALESRVVDLGFDYSGYNIKPPKFIVADSSNFYEPLVYELINIDLLDAYLGFSHKNRNYVGLKEIIKDLKWAKSENCWNVSKENYENYGIVQLANKKI